MAIFKMISGNGKYQDDLAIPNLIALLALSKVIVKETKAFTEKLNVEEKNQRILKGMNAENA